MASIFVIDPYLLVRVVGCYREVKASVRGEVGIDGKGVDLEAVNRVGGEFWTEYEVEDAGRGGDGDDDDDECEESPTETAAEAVAAFLGRAGVGYGYGAAGRRTRWVEAVGAGGAGGDEGGGGFGGVGRFEVDGMDLLLLGHA